MTPRCGVATALATIGLAIGLANAGNAAAADPPAKCNLIKTAEWSVRPSRGHAVVEGAINGQTVGILLDTGATHSLLLRPAAVRLGLVGYDTGAIRVMGVGGESAAQTVSVDEFAIGKDVRRNWRMLVAGEHDLGGDIAVILGEDFFHQTDVEFDLANNAIRLFQPRDCKGASLAYWATDGAGIVEFDPVDAARPRIMLTVEINGRPVAAMLDSGAFASALTKSQAASLGVTTGTAGTVFAGCGAGVGQKSIENWMGQFETFSIGNELIRNPKINFADLWKYSTLTEPGTRVKTRAGDLPEMLLGADFLRSHRVLVAHSQRKMYFTYAGGTVFQAPRLGPCDGFPKADAAKSGSSGN